MGLGFTFADLYKAPEINPINKKARSIPALNPINLYGRVFFFSWFGFMIAFWAWYTFPPLLTATIKTDLNLSSVQIANSNIVSLCATLLIRVSSGPLCDLFGPRRVFGGLLLVGAIPLGLAPLVQNASGLYASRFFIGILGGSFVPCQVWSTGFFDKNVVGTANAFTGGWGNAGGGITYFIMPAVFDSLVHSGYSADKAWRLTFIVPLIMILVVGVSLLLLCPDTPVGKWSDRKVAVQSNLHSHGVDESPIVDVPGTVDEKPATTESVPSDKGSEKEKPVTSGHAPHANYDHEAVVSKEEMLNTAHGEVIVKPSFGEIVKVALSPQTIVQMLCYFCSFGAELAINAILANYYIKNFPTLGQTGAANWAAMFGFLNFVTRPLGGIISDIMYDLSGHSLWLKKGWMHTCGLLSGIFLIIAGTVDSHSLATFNGLIALAAIFIEAGNGANFSLVPHVHPYANGIVSGFTGGIGNFGGVIFAIVFRFMGDGTNYAKSFWVIGVIHVALNLALCWIPPIPKGQIGGR